VNSRESKDKSLPVVGKSWLSVISLTLIWVAVFAMSQPEGVKTRPRWRKLVKRYPSQLTELSDIHYPLCIIPWAQQCHPFPI